MKSIDKIKKDLIREEGGFLKSKSYKDFLSRNQDNIITQDDGYFYATSRDLEIELAEEKQTKIEENDKYCCLKICELLSATNEEEAKIKQINMLLAQASKEKNANEEIKKFESEKQKIRTLNKQLNSKIQQAKSIDEIKKYDLKSNIEEIKEIKGIEEIK